MELSIIVEIILLLRSRRF